MQGRYYLTLGLALGLFIGVVISSKSSNDPPNILPLQTTEKNDRKARLKGTGSIAEVVQPTPQPETIEERTHPQENFELTEKNGIYDFSDIKQPTGSTPLERFLNCPEWYFANPDLGKSDIIALATSALQSQRYKDDLTKPGLSDNGYASGELWIPGLNNGVYLEFNICAEDGKPHTYDLNFKFPALTSHRKPFETEVDLMINLYFDLEVYSHPTVSIEVEPDSHHLDASPDVRFQVQKKGDRLVQYNTHTKIPKKDIDFFQEDWNEFLRLRETIDELYEALQR